MSDQEKPPTHVVFPVGIESDEGFDTAQVTRRVGWQWIYSGYSHAMDRLGAALAQHNDEAAFHALFEALNWTVSLTDYLDDRGERVENRTLRGVRFARNSVHHRWADALERRESPTPTVRVASAGGRRGGSATFTTPAVTIEWCWRPAEELPPAKGRWRKKKWYRDGEAAYSECLATKHVASTLDHLKGVFDQLTIE
jgi:hypothetical protein